MRIHDLVQGSDEWQAFRAEHFTGSEAPAMMGKSKFMTRNELLWLKYSGVTDETTSFQQKIYDQGHSYEEMARPFAEKIIGDDLYPVTGTPDEDFGIPLSASFDGLTMLEETSFEHKQLNKDLAVKIPACELDEMYAIQNEQGLMVSGADRCLFMASVGEEETAVWMWYESNPELRQRIIDGWKQFAIDLENYEPPEEEVVVAVQALKELPTLSIAIAGSVDSSNLPAYRETALTFISNINTDLATDEDFANAENTVKFCKRAETELKDVKSRALSQTADIDELFRTIEHLSEELRQKRLTLEKSVKSRKVEIRTEIIEDTMNKFSEFYANLVTNLDGYAMPRVECNAANAMKGKKTVASLRNAADTTLAEAKIEVNKIAAVMRENIDKLKENEDYAFLFNDAQASITKDPEHFALIVDRRVSAHKKQEEERLEFERDNIRLEEEKKAREKLEAEQLLIKQEDEKKRLDEERISKMISDIRELPVMLSNADSVRIKQQLVSLTTLHCYQNVSDGVDEAVKSALEELEGFYKAAVAQENAEIKKESAAKTNKCDGNHGGPSCSDPECWIDGEPTVVYVQDTNPINQEKLSDDLDKLREDMTNDISSGCAIQSFIDNGYSKEESESIVDLILRGMIANVTIN